MELVDIAPVRHLHASSVPDAGSPDGLRDIVRRRVLGFSRKDEDDLPVALGLYATGDNDKTVVVCSPEWLTKNRMTVGM